MEHACLAAPDSRVLRLRPWAGLLVLLCTAAAAQRAAAATAHAGPHWPSGAVRRPNHPGRKATQTLSPRVLRSQRLPHLQRRLLQDDDEDAGKLHAPPPSATLAPPNGSAAGGAWTAFANTSSQLVGMQAGPAAGPAGSSPAAQGAAAGGNRTRAAAGGNGGSADGLPAEGQALAAKGPPAAPAAPDALVKPPPSIPGMGGWPPPAPVMQRPLPARPSSANLAPAGGSRGGGGAGGGGGGAGGPASPLADVATPAPTGPPPPSIPGMGESVQLPDSAVTGAAVASRSPAAAAARAAANAPPAVNTNYGNFGLVDSGAPRSSLDGCAARLLSCVRALRFSSQDHECS